MSNRSLTNVEVESPEEAVLVTDAAPVQFRRSGQYLSDPVDAIPLGSTRGAGGLSVPAFQEADAMSECTNDGNDDSFMDLRRFTTDPNLASTHKIPHTHSTNDPFLDSTVPNLTMGNFFIDVPHTSRGERPQCDFEGISLQPPSTLIRTTSGNSILEVQSEGDMEEGEALIPEVRIICAPADPQSSEEGNRPIRCCFTVSELLDDVGAASWCESESEYGTEGVESECPADVFTFTGTDGKTIEKPAIKKSTPTLPVIYI